VQCVSNIWNRRRIQRCQFATNVGPSPNYYTTLNRYNDTSWRNSATTAESNGNKIFISSRWKYCNIGVIHDNSSHDRLTAAETIDWLWPPYVIANAIIFLPCGFFYLSIYLSIYHLSSIYSFSSPNLSGRRVDVYHTSTHGVTLVRI